MWQKMSNYALKLHLQKQPFPKCIIGIDFGMKSTGISITSSDLLHAFYLTTIRKDIRSKQFKEDLSRFFRKQQPLALVIGKPNYVIESQQKESIIDIINQFVAEAHLDHPKIENYRFTFVDESWTTLNAKSQLKAIENEIRQWGHLSREKELVDGMAAINILRKYLEFFHKN